MKKGKRVTISMSRIVIRWVIIARRANMNHEGDHKVKQNCDQKDNHKLARRGTKGYSIEGREDKDEQNHD
jgi:hypothetical protein